MYIRSLSQVNDNAVCLCLQDHGPLAEADVARVMYEALQTVAACHEHSFYHGDVKPANFMLKDEPRTGAKGLGLDKCESSLSVIRHPYRLSVQSAGRNARWFAHGATVAAASCQRRMPVSWQQQQHPVGNAVTPPH